MKKRILSMFIAIAMIFTAIPTMVVTVGAVEFTVNGVNQNINWFSENGETYVKLRDVAAALNGTPQQFRVEHSPGVVALTTGQSYNDPHSLDLQEGRNVESLPRENADLLILNATEQAISGYRIEGFNYYNLDELANLIGFTAAITDDVISIITPGGGNQRTDNQTGKGEVFRKITDNLPTSDTVREYTFTLPTDGKLSVQFEHEFADNANERWRIILIDADNLGVQLLNFTSSGNQARTIETFGYIAAGTYRVRVQSGGNNDYYNYWNADYTLTVNFAPNNGTFEVEHNNTSATATKIEVNKPIVGNLYSINDEDWFEFELTKSGKLSLQFEHEFADNANERWRIILIDADNLGIQLLSFNSRGNQAKIDEYFGYIAAGTYRVRVQCEWSYVYRNDDYTLIVNYEEIISHTVTFNANGGEVSVKSKTVNDGEEIGILPIPVYEGHSFSGWFTIQNQSGGTQLSDKTEITADVTYFARWTINSYSITATAQEGGTVTGGGSRNHGTNVTLRATAAAGYNFDGWYEGNTRVSENALYTFTATENRTLQARFTIAVRPGHVLGNDTIGIGDALEILKYLAGMTSVVNQNNSDSWSAARITGGDKPVIGDVLEILKKLAGMKSLLD